MKKILYAGDTRLDGAAAYLAGVMTYHQLPFDYINGAFADAPGKLDYALYILSDYAVKHFAAGELDALAAAIRGGAGLLMIGGWESYHGSNGEYHRSPLADVLPVSMRDSDDRVNSYQPCVVHRVADHPAVSGLPWEKASAVGGFNRIAAKPGAQTVLELDRVELRWTADGLKVSSMETAPLLVVGLCGAGRVAAFASDVAPHWVGPLVDWGDRRVSAQACLPRANDVEVGNWYAQFLGQLVSWTAGRR